MRRAALGLALCLLSVSAVCGLFLVGDADAYTFPSGASTSSSCPSFLTDPTQSATDNVLPAQTLTVTSGTEAYSGTATVAAGEYLVAWGGPNGTWNVQSETSGSVWNIVEAGQTSQIYGVGSLYPMYLPAGPAKVEVSSNSAGTYQLLLIPVSEAAATADAQGLAVVCDAIAAGTAQSLSNGETLSTIAADLSTIETELGGTLDVSTGGPTGTQQVILSPADRQLLADSANGAHSDVWDVVGIALGAFVCWMLVRALWRP